MRGLSAGIEEKSDYSYATVYALDSSGVKHDLLETVYLCDGLSHDLANGFGCDGEDGTWYSLSFDAVDGIHAQVSNGDTATNYTGFPLRLGMCESGLIYALDFWDEAGGEELFICALQPGNGMLVMQHLTGGSPFGLRPGETIYLLETYGRQEGENMQVTISKLPTNLSEFEALASSGREPERICALFLCALSLFDRNKDDGTAAMNLLRGPRPMTPYDVQFLRDLLPGTQRFGELKKSVGNRRS